jgi:hypothetical protein
MHTDGPREGFPNVSPAAIVCGGTSHAFYHFTIAEDQARFIDASLSVLLVDVAPEVAHTYRLELHGTEPYMWWIDGQVVDSAIPEGPYPTASSEIVFGARAATADGVTSVRWDSVRFGRIPDDQSGDYDSDAAVTLIDHYFFTDCLTKDGPGIFGGPQLGGDPGVGAGPGCRWADTDADSDVDLADFAEFQNRFTGSNP